MTHTRDAGRQLFRNSVHARRGSVGTLLRAAVLFTVCKVTWQRVVAREHNGAVCTARGQGWTDRTRINLTQTIRSSTRQSKPSPPPLFTAAPGVSHNNILLRTRTELLAAGQARVIVPHWRDQRLLVQRRRASAGATGRPVALRWRHNPPSAASLCDANRCGNGLTAYPIGGYGARRCKPSHRPCGGGGPHSTLAV